MKLTEEQEQWLQALESGKYEQGTCELRTANDLFCCLGVACEVLIPETRQVMNKKQFLMDCGGTSVINLYGEEENSASAPREVIEKLHLHNRYGALRIGSTLDGRIYSSLVEINDSGGHSFAQIAAFIRANPEKVFRRGADE